MNEDTETKPALSAFDLIDDPFIGVLMKRDGVEPDELRRLIERVRRRRRQHGADLAA
ncbi:MAG TPA: hypothetical protein VFO41_01145 [Alphaproteobacteria bacterium]|nr:hypothetical protein [Alphaproteobacteria bacterium]